VDAIEARSTLADILQQLRLDHLRQIASQRGWAIEARDKAGYAGALAPLLSDATHVARAVTSLPPGLREALRAALVIEDGHGITPEELAHVITALRGLDGAHFKPVEAAGVLVDLAAQGLLLPWDSFPGATTYLFPWEIQAAVPPLPGWCPRPRCAPAVEPSAPKELSFTALLDTVWQHIALEPPRLRLPPQLELSRHTSKIVQGWPFDPREIQDWQHSQGSRGNEPPRSLAVPPVQMLLDDEHLDRLVQLSAVTAEKLEFVLQLLLELELAAKEDDRLVSRPDAMDRFVRIAPIRQKRVVAQAYISMLDWSELDTLLRADGGWVLTRNPYFSISHMQFRSHLARIRQMVARFLATAGQRRCCPLTLLEAALPRLWPAFFRLRSSDEARLLPAALELSMRQSQDPQKVERYPPQVAFLRTMLFGPLQWLGLTRTCPEHGEAIAIWSDGLDELLWGSPSETHGAQAAEPVGFDTSTRTITVQPNAVDPDVPAFLGQIALLESVHEGRFIFRLDMRAAHAAFVGGKLLSELEADWRETMALPMPDAFRGTLEEWWARYGEVRLYEGFALLEVNDEVTLRELEATTSLGQHILARVSPRHILVPAEQVGDLMGQIRARGHTPQQVE
jgi:hypothetical protein